MAGRKSPKCTICGKPQKASISPFCSARCADVDLHRWLSGGYRIPTDEAPDEGELDKALDEDQPGGTPGHEGQIH